jgi:hypothetical protein
MRTYLSVSAYIPLIKRANLLLRGTFSIMVASMHIKKNNMAEKAGMPSWKGGLMTK